MRKLENFRISRPLGAVGPIAAKEQTVRAEYVPNMIQAIAIEAHIKRHAAVYAADNAGNFRKDVGARCERPQIGIVREFQLRQVVEDDAEIRDAIRHS